MASYLHLCSSCNQPCDLQPPAESVQTPEIEKLLGIPDEIESSPVLDGSLRETTVEIKAAGKTITVSLVRAIQMLQCLLKERGSLESKLRLALDCLEIGKRCCRKCQRPDLLERHNIECTALSQIQLLTPKA